MGNNVEHTKGLRQFLDDSGVLVNGNDEEIKAARRAYRKKYLAEYKQQQRKENPEFAVLLSTQNGEHGKIVGAACRHKVSVPAFLKMATLAYLNKTFISPDREVVSRLAQLLTNCLNEVQVIAQTKSSYPWQIDEKYVAIEKRIADLENEIRKLFQFPVTIETAVRDAVLKDPTLKLRLLNLLVH